MKYHAINFEDIPPDLEYNENITLWRYMSFSSLCEILIYNCIPMIGIHNFSDKSEGAILERILCEMPGAHGDSVQYAMKLYRETTYVSSWYMSEDENAAMWDRYTYSGEGVAIKTNAKLLIDCIKAKGNKFINNSIIDHQSFSDESIDTGQTSKHLKGGIIIKSVKYASDNPQDFTMCKKYLTNGYDLLCFFYKSDDFRDEKEVRILMSTDRYMELYNYPQTHPSVFPLYHVNIGGKKRAWMDSMVIMINSASDLIQKIVISPYAHSQFFNTVKETIRCISEKQHFRPGLIEIDIIRSRQSNWLL